MKILVGDTGFVGSNLVATMKFDRTFNSKNIIEAYGSNPDLLIYAGVRGTKFLANKQPEDDLENIINAQKNIELIRPKKLILISTVDVYDDLDSKNEDYEIDSTKLHVYGKHRFILEKWVQDNIVDFHIIRLPAIYGINLKKNYVHDLIDPIPSYISKEDFKSIKKEFNEISSYYTLRDEFYVLKRTSLNLLKYFSKSKYSSIRFTDSRSEYQYYDLRQLHELIRLVIKENIKVINCVTEPVRSEDLYKIINKREFKNCISKDPIKYRLETKYAYLYDLKKYLVSQEDVLKDLSNFISKERKQT